MGKATFSIAKAVHYTYFSIDYLKDVIVSENLRGDSKDFINSLIKRQEWVLRELYARMTPEGATKLRNELEARDIAAIDSILNLVIALSEDKRLELEEVLETFCKEVKTTPNEKENTPQ